MSAHPWIAFARCVDYAFVGLRDGLGEAIDGLRAETLRGSWENFVYDAFRRKFGSSLTEAQARTRRLVLVISTREEPWTRAEIQAHPQLVAAYAARSRKTLTRDLRVVRRLDLVEALPRGRFQARMDHMLAFRVGDQPPRTTAEGPPVEPGHQLGLSLD